MGLSPNIVPGGFEGGSAPRTFGLMTGGSISTKAFAGRGPPMVQKVSEVVGVSTEGFAKAAENAVHTAAKTVRNLRWFRVTEMEGSIKDQKVAEYHVTVKIYFDLEP